MKQLILILTTLLFATHLTAQNESVFEFTDSVFSEQSIHRVNVNYYYGGGGHVVKDSLGLIELQELSEFINRNPNLLFELEYHTDYRGSEEFNLDLSEHRIKNLLRELIGNYQVDSSQVKARGYGESKPILKERFFHQTAGRELNECTLEALHAVNRRTILRIINIIE